MSKKSGARSKRKSSVRRPVWRRVFLWLCLFVLVFGALGFALIDWTVREKFEGKKWSMPARVFARPLELYVSKPMRVENLEAELSLLNYQLVGSLSRPGQMQRSGKDLLVYPRTSGHQPLRIGIRDEEVVILQTLEGQELALTEFEPLEIGGIYPRHQEDRELVSLIDVPPLLGEALIAVEDKNFAHHFGVSPRSIARAALANFRAGYVVQGGSTITQQLIKNFYLDSRQNLSRKFLELLMALSLEFHYTKAEILETYLNEVYLGQSGARGIHGFALASKHYFGKELQRLDAPHLALLVALVKGASYYNPWRHPERAMERRNLVLKIMFDEGLIKEADYRSSLKRPLGLVEKSQASRRAYPAFLDSVKRQLLRDYQDEDLRTEGLLIYTTLNPLAQKAAEEALSSSLLSLEHQHELPENQLQGALVMLDIGSAEITAMVGDRQAQFSGFNRALDIRRPIGSLVKPAVYLAALDQGYTLGQQISDEPVTVKGKDGSLWSPRNFSRQSHGEVPFYQALANSYNQATARLGMKIGLKAVRDSIVASGVGEDFPLVPATLLGSLDLSPLSVASMYHTYASGGFFTAPQAIRSVATPQGDVLNRYPLKTEQRFSPDSVYLLNYALSAVMHEGTGKSAKVGASRRLAGKTGTTNDQRDSWFSGYDGDDLAVVWLGRDDNGKTPLTGGTGALQVWDRLFKRFPGRGLNLARPDSVDYYWIDGTSSRLSGENCKGALLLPLRSSNVPEERARCEWRKNPILQWWKRVWSQ